MRTSLPWRDRNSVFGASVAGARKRRWRPFEAPADDPDFAYPIVVYAERHLVDFCFGKHKSRRPHTRRYRPPAARRVRTTCLLMRRRGGGGGDVDHRLGTLEVSMSREPPQLRRRGLSC